MPRATLKTPISLHAIGANGQAYGQMDDNQAQGMDPDEFARQLLRAVAKQREEVYIGGVETYGVYLKRFLPGLLSRIIQKRDKG